eukprot:gene4383-biopygen11462
MVAVGMVAVAPTTRTLPLLPLNFAKPHPRLHVHLRSSLGILGRAEGARANAIGALDAPAHPPALPPNPPHPPPPDAAAPARRRPRRGAVAAAAPRRADHRDGRATDGRAAVAAALPPARRAGGGGGSASPKPDYPLRSILCCRSRCHPTAARRARTGTCRSRRSGLSKSVVPAPVCPSVHSYKCSCSKPICEYCTVAVLHSLC